MSSIAKDADKKTIEDIFAEIGKKISDKYTKTDIFIPSYKLIANNKNFYITLLFKKSTPFNSFKDDIFFTITLSENYPEEQPYVRCLTNFTLPTLYDNRNLLYSIINHYWSMKGITDPFVPIDEIINKIPDFLKKINENCINKTLVYYGDYTIDDIYEMNDFLLNGEISFYRVTQYLKKKCERYIILTDIYCLLFDPAPDAKNLGKLMFIGDIRQLSKRKLGKNKNDDTIIIEYVGGETDLKFEFAIMNSSITDFINEADRKIKRLKDRYVVYQEDEVKQGDATSNLFKEKLSKSNLEDITKLITYKEKLYKERKTLNLIKELTILYEKVIEIYSADSDPKFEEYLNKLKEMIKEKDTLEHIDQENSSKQICQMSKSYNVEEEK